MLGYTLNRRSKQTLRPLLIYGCLVTTTRHVNHNSYSSKLTICLYWKKNIKGPESTAEESSVTVTFVFVELHNVIITVSVTFVIRIDGSGVFTPKNPCLQISSPLLLAGEIITACLKWPRPFALHYWQWRASISLHHSTNESLLPDLGCREDWSLDAE